MNDCIGSWGLFQWFEGLGVDHLHPDDVNAIRRLAPSGKVFECIGADNEYLVLRYSDCRFRVRPSLYKTVTKPAQVIGDVVRFKKEGKECTGTVCDIMWHFKREEPFYFISVDGVKLKKRYWVADFGGVSQGG